MIKIPDVVTIGSSGVKGLWSPGVVVIGGAKKSIPDIDLLADILDSRVNYTGPAHYYWAEDGTIKQTSSNQWPVEYISGVAVGRHEPEAASSNLATTSTLDNLTATASGSVTQYRETVTNSYHRVRIADSLTNATQSAQLIYKAVGRTNFYFRAPITSASTNNNAAINDNVMGYVSTGYSSASVKSVGDLRVVQLAFNDKGSSDGFLTSNAAVTDDSVGSFAGDTAKGFDAYFIQTESSAFSSSPMATGASRAASSVIIDTTGASSLMLHFSDGTAQSNSVNGSYTLPLSTQNWGDRYLTRISFEV